MAGECAAPKITPACAMGSLSFWFVFCSHKWMSLIKLIISLQGLYHVVESQQRPEESRRNDYGGELICNALCPKVCGVGDWELLCLREINFLEGKNS